MANELTHSWYPFKAAEAKKHMGGGITIITRFNAKSYIGIPLEVTDRFVVLANGSDTQMLYFDREPTSTRFTTIQPPGNLTFGVGEHRLPLP